ncbi:MAG: EAL domain-containing protein [Acidimicrobiales bacterium]|nr:EAL domain-containing protein [Acidimicrobiales bacterium]
MAVAVVLYALAWSASFLAGGAWQFAPHLFYLPVILLGVRFGTTGAIVGGGIAAVVAGPLLPAVSATGANQELSDWLSRGAFFIIIGVAVTRLIRARLIDEVAGTLDELELRAAIDEDQLELHYQPIVVLHDQRVIGAEALVRWRHPTRGLLGPDQFIPLAEVRGVIDALGDWVVSAAVADMRTWQEALGGGPLPIQELNVNVSRRQLYSDSRLARRLSELTADRALPVRLVVEVTETSLSNDQAALVDELMNLRLSGIQIAVDDFGVGYSSIVSLRDLPIDVIKLDKSFVHGLTTDSSDNEIVKNTVALADRLGKRLIAEGVETHNQRRMLHEMGVTRAQGYLFARPMPFEELTDWIETRRSDGAETAFRHKILVVDDNQSDRRLASMLLFEHAELWFADDGWQAIALLAEHAFSLVLLDMEMPGMSGFQTIEAIRNLERADTHGLRHTIVALSALEPFEVDTSMCEARADAHLSKPLDIEQLDRALRQLGQPALVSSARGS